MKESTLLCFERTFESTEDCKTFVTICQTVAYMLAKREDTADALDIGEFVTETNYESWVRFIIDGNEDRAREVWNEILNIFTLVTNAQ